MQGLGMELWSEAAYLYWWWWHLTIIHNVVKLQILFEIMSLSWLALLKVPHLHVYVSPYFVNELVASIF